MVALGGSAVAGIAGRAFDEASAEGCRGVSVGSE
jgi:hypothetical protein